MIRAVSLIELVWLVTLLYDNPKIMEAPGSDHGYCLIITEHKGLVIVQVHEMMARSNIAEF